MSSCHFQSFDNLNYHKIKKNKKTLLLRNNENFLYFFGKMYKKIYIEMKYLYSPFI